MILSPSVCEVAEKVMEESGLKSYEGMFIIRPDIPDDQAGKIADGITGEITKIGGKVEERTLSSKQRLAYPIGRHPDGYSLSLRFQAPSREMENLKSRLKSSQDLLRHLILVRK